MGCIAVLAQCIAHVLHLRRMAWLISNSMSPLWVVALSWAAPSLRALSHSWLPAARKAAPAPLVPLPAPPRTVPSTTTSTTPSASILITSRRTRVLRFPSSCSMRSPTSTTTRTRSSVLLLSPGMPATTLPSSPSICARAPSSTTVTLWMPRPSSAHGPVSCTPRAPLRWSTARPRFPITFRWSRAMTSLLLAIPTSLPAFPARTTSRSWSS